MTLTLVSSDEPLSKQFASLRSAFRRLRQQTAWMETQEYGWAVLEATWNDSTAQWHPHLHVVSRGKFLHHKRLSAMWQQASRGSFVVHICSLGKRSQASNYVAKYVGKAPEFNEPARALAPLAEWIAATFKTHMIITFGNLPEPDESLDHDDPEQSVTARLRRWEPIAPLYQVIWRAAEGDSWSIHVLRCLETGRPYIKRALPNDHAPPVDLAQLPEQPELFEVPPEMVPHDTLPEESRDRKRLLFSRMMLGSCS
jgi:hypothetical protein